MSMITAEYTVQKEPYVQRQAIMGFQNNHRWLSNFWPAEVSFGDVIFPTVEHGFVAAKLTPEKPMPYVEFLSAVSDAGLSRAMADKLPRPSSGIQLISYTDLLNFISHVPTPGKAKSFGKQIPLREDWEDMKIQVMRDLTAQKYDIAELQEKLLATKGRSIVEFNTWGDDFWGMVDVPGSEPGISEVGTFEPGMGVMTGRNVLGQIIESERYSLQCKFGRGRVRSHLTIDMCGSSATHEDVKKSLSHIFGEYSGDLIELDDMVVFTISDVPDGNIDAVLHPCASKVLTNLRCQYLWTSEGGPRLPPTGIAYDPEGRIKPTSFFHTGLDDYRITVLPNLYSSGDDLNELRQIQQFARRIREREAKQFALASVEKKGEPETLKLPIGMSF